ncbi:BatA domain-containing protein [Hymenobacter sp. BT635]|uniref:BatA domain-containing protein n=1 Tax=Hymenobacter nitidus TaxID=2880929 RepID=A0ABS8AAZ7_9BACT|nr:BatA domain-containing protein [Hymenobacter nitidus]MCB2377580.1 BatA domain-containing protein [Hymenobacter nitidus]
MTLTYPWFLLGLLALAIPLAIHFFELRRPQRLLFTNVGFIREIKLVTARQRKLKHLLVLAARMGFIAFLVLLFCQPFIPAPEQSQVNDGGIVASLVDASPSMVVEGDQSQPLFDQAVAEAQELPSAYPASARYVLPASSNAVLTAPAFQTAVQQLTISGQTKSLANGLERAKSVANAKHIFVFSDFQKNSFNPQALLTDSTSQLYLVPLQGRQTANVFVDSVLLDDAFVRTGADLNLRVRLRNGGMLAAPDCQVKVFVGSRQVATYRVAVPARESIVSAVRVRLDGEAAQQCRVEVEDLPVTFDNTYYFTLQASPQIRILNITAPQAAAVSRVYNNESMFSYSGSPAARLDYSLLNTANLLVLEEVPKLDNALRENLRRAVVQGATLVIVPPAGNPTTQEEYNRLFRELGIGGIQWERPQVGAPVLQDVAAPSLQSPFFQDVFTASNQRAGMPRVAPVLRWSRSATEILKMRNGDGFLAGFTSGRGKVFLFAAPFQSAYSDFTQHALFVPVMYRLAMLSYQSEQRIAYRLNQGTVALSLKPQAKTQRDEPVVSLRKDSLTVIPAQRWEAGTLRLTIPAVVQEPGFYQVIYNDKVVATLALNIDKAESELAYYSANDLRQLIGPNRPNVQVYESTTNRSVAAHYKALRVGTPLWRYCLLLALACLLAEVLLLRFVGRPRAVPAAAVAA